jgi:hypothetical protein
MKTVALGLCLVLFFSKAFCQTGNAAGQVIEGGKVVVELIKALRGKTDKNPGCKDLYADVCIMNESPVTIMVLLQKRETGEKREMVVQSKMRECCLRTSTGVWTYDLRINENAQPIRKGDLLIEGCQNLTMNVKF